MAANRGTKVALAAMAVIIVVLGVLLFLQTRDDGDDVSRTPTAQGPTRPGSARLGPATNRPGAPTPPPLTRYNELGQPLNEDGRPIGPPDKLRRIRNRPLEPGAVPLVPPLFDDPSDRAAFKKWWVDEVARRVSIYEELEPGDYPTADETRDMLEDYYDAAEPRGPDESIEAAYERRQNFRGLWQQFLDDYGATIKTVTSRGGDPQYGETPDPPVDPPGVVDEDAPPAEGAGQPSGAHDGPEGHDH